MSIKEITNTIQFQNWSYTTTEIKHLIRFCLTVKIFQQDSKQC